MTSQERAMLDMQEAWQAELRKVRKERNDLLTEIIHIEASYQKKIEQKDATIARQDAHIERLKARLEKLTKVELVKQ